MSVRNILCAYNGKNTAISSLGYAIKITKHHSGWLTGMVRRGTPVLETRFGGQFPSEIIGLMHENDMARIKEVSESFAVETKINGIADRSEFVELTDEKGAALGRFARSFDLVVSGVPENDMSMSHLAAHPDVLALHSGRPVLVVPDHFKSKGLADHALIAWDGKRSAARALGDAMSILEEKAKVTVLCVGNTAPEGTDRLIQNIARHGIQVELVVRTKANSVSQTILETTTELGAQLIVMGAYEHSKFSHDFFGGPSTEVIAGAKTPVFMSH